jgi:phosphohistidine phosphatase
MGDVTSAHTLVVIRHAKAEPYADTDAERSLTRRGHTEAEGAGRFLAEAGIRPDVALVSAAVRTRETWAHVLEATGASAEAEFSDALYAASADDVLDALRRLPEGAATAAYVGHNPAAGSMAVALDDGEGDPSVVRGLLEGFPTAAVAVYEVPGPWAELTEGAARLTHFHAPAH